MRLKKNSMPQAVDQPRQKTLMMNLKGKQNNPAGNLMGVCGVSFTLPFFNPAGCFIREWFKKTGCAVLFHK